MLLKLPFQLAGPYRSPVQKVRVVTEAWGESNLYCASCTAEYLRRSVPNTEAIDFSCPKCNATYQLKSRSRPFGPRIVDAAFSAMSESISSGRVPNLFGLHYDGPTWEVRNLFLIPSFALSMSAIEARRPLSSTARRSGWVGCYILLERIPLDARIFVIEHGTVARPNDVRHKYERLKPLAALKQGMRGWALDVLNVIRGLRKVDFTLADVYGHVDELAAIHPDNVHVHAKVRQQLQRLRDAGLIEFLGEGRYRLVG